jgi:hypothetical protein
MDPVYQNHPLTAPKSARFLLPSARGECGTLRYRFTVQSLDEAVRYSALSHVWGDPKCCGTFIIDGTLYRVRSNLLLALERIDTILDCHSDIDVGMVGFPMLLWADQVCI